MKPILYPVGNSYAYPCISGSSLLRTFLLLMIFVVSFVGAKAQFQFGENPGYYGSQFTDQQLYDLMYAGGARATRSSVPFQSYLQYGMPTYEARLQYPYSTKGMRNNTFFLFASNGPVYTGQSDSTASNGARSWIPTGIYLAPFNSDGSINTSNLWAKYCYDVVQSIGPYFTYFEVWNEPDLTGSVNSYEDSTQSSTSWESTEPASGDLPNLNAPLEDYVQLCKIANEVIKKYQPTAKIATGGLGYPWFYQWFLRKGGGQWIDELSIHFYPYFSWTTCSWTGSACGPAGFHRNSDYAVQCMTNQIAAFRAIETQEGAAHKPMMMTESNIPRWSYVSAANLENFPNNKAWGSDATQKNYTIKAFTKMLEGGLDMFYLYQTGETGDSGLNDGTAGSEIDAMGMYKNLTKATPGNTIFTNQGIAVRTMQSLMNNYKLDATQPTFPSGVDGVRFDSSGNKIYVVWAITTVDMSETASGSYTLPTGTNFKKYLYDGSSPGLVSGSISLIGDPYILVQTSGTITSVNCDAGTNQTLTLPTNTATLDASGSTATGTTISSYAWSQVSGPNTATLTNAQTVTATASNLVAGNYVFQIKAKDAGSDSCASTVQITVNAAVTPPTVSAGVTQTITLPTSSTSLIGVATDLSATITGYSWTQVSGPNTATISTSTALTTAIKGLVAGTYVFQLKVTDSNGNSATATVTITVVAAANQPPVANAGNNQTITLPLDSVTLNGSASKDLNGTITTYGWQQISGPSTSTIRNAAGVTTVATNLAQGSYSFQLTVTDNNGLKGVDTVVITVNAAANKPPVANAGASQTVELPTNTTTLDGSASYDPDGTIAAYSWKQLSGPSTATITGGTTAKPGISGLVQGTYTFQLTVTDNDGATSTASVKITVASATNLPPVANAGPNQTISLPLDSVTLNGSASKDPDGTIAAYSWTQVSGPTTSTVRTAGNVTTIVSKLAQGSYTFQLLVTDNNGATDVDTVVITVNAAVNKPPVANAGTNQTITLPTNTVLLNGSASSDPDGNIVSYSWIQVAGPSASTITGGTTSTPTASGLGQGRYTFQLTVTDNNGSTASATVRITVLPAVNVNPIADAGANQTITLPLDSVVLDGSGSSAPTGSITGYNWSELSGPATATIENAGGSTTTVTSLAQGTYVFQLIVTSSGGGKDTDAVTITVNAAVHIPPVANAGTTQTLTLPTDSTTLDGSGSSDPDGTITSYSWTQVAGPSAAVITGAGTVKPAISSLVAGRYTFELTVTDNDGGTDNAMVRITVVAPNNLPVANAGANQTITLPLDSATLDGSASIDQGGTITSYAWTQVAGPSTATIEKVGGVSTVVTNMAQGTYTFKLTVINNTGGRSTDTVSIIVNPLVHIPPVANAGASQTITLPDDSVSLYGSNSYAPDGAIVSYSWSQISGPSTASIAGVATATPAISGLVAGRYIFQLTVTDNDGVTATGTVRITVIAAPNQAPIANAGPDQTIVLPTNSAKLDGSKSYDPDGSVVSYSWSLISGSGSATILNPNTATPTVTGLQAGIYVFQLVVTDNLGSTGTDEVQITVNAAANQPPVANAGPDQALVLPTNSTTLNGTKSYDPDGAIVSYDWTEVSGPSNAVIGNYNTPTPSIGGLIAGQYIFKLTVTDNDGASSSDEMIINVTASLMPPIANAGADTTIALPANSSILNGSASIAQSGKLMSYQWVQLSGPSKASIAASDSSVTPVGGLSSGAYNFQLTVTDNYGQSSTASVTVTVMDELRTSGASTVVLYPNPAQSTVNLQLTSDSTGTMRISIYDMLGNLVYTQQTEKSQSFYNSQINVSKLAGGVYNMQVVIGTNKPINARLIKQ